MLSRGHAVLAHVSSPGSFALRYFGVAAGPVDLNFAARQTSSCQH